METHHIVFRSQVVCRAIKDISYNLKDLESERHRGNNSPHHNKEFDLVLKRELQKFYMQLFPEDELTEEQICKRLRIKEKQFIKLWKHLKFTGNGYDKYELVKVLMGGRFYW